MPIERKIETRFIGVIIDESLKWSRHVKTVISKLSRYVGITYKIKKILPLRGEGVFMKFFKGPMLYSTSGIRECLGNNVFLTIKSFKIKLRNIILNWQSEGDKTKWKPDNFVLSKFNGLRSSASINTTINYTHFFNPLNTTSAVNDISHLKVMSNFLK